MRGRLCSSASVRWLPLAVFAAGFFVLALRGDVYEATSPHGLGWHVALRKAYSVGAFALVGAAYAFARRCTVGESALAIALYSGAIEIGQWFTSDEELTWNLVDVTCGGLGGALGAAAVIRARAVRGK